MNDQPLAPEQASAAALHAEATQDWQAAMEAVADEDGYLEPLGARHWAFFAEDGPELLVTFERAEDLRARDGQMPAAWALARARGWSLLTILAEGETWWRDTAVWGYFDRLVDDAFFDDFDRVLFHGAADAGYAAASLMVTAPGASALLIAPRATLASDRAGWDHRHLTARRLDFTSRYGYAPDMTEGAERVSVLLDPSNQEDAAHAALFLRPWVQLLRARHTGEDTAAGLARIGLLDQLLAEAMAGTLDEARFAQAWRAARRNWSGYLRTVLHKAALSGSARREMAVCRAVVARLKAPRFARRLAELEAAAAAPVPASAPETV